MKKRLVIFIILIYGLKSSSQSLDQNYGKNGLITNPAASFNERLFDLAELKDGKVITVGTTLKGLNWNYLIKRHLSNGFLDTSFNSSGMVTGSFGDSIQVLSLATVLSDGNFLVCGSNSLYVNSFFDRKKSFFLAKFKSNGLIDSSFGINGKADIIFGIGSHEIRALKIQNDGKIILAGSFGLLPERDAVIARYKSNGTIDSSFGSYGVFKYSVSKNEDWVNAITIQKDGKLLLTGGGNLSTNSDFFIIRIENYGKLDTLFGKKGVASVDIGNYDESTSIVLQPDEKIIVGGMTLNEHLNLGTGERIYIPDFSLARFDSNGIIDSSFGNKGMVNIYDFDNETGVIHSIFLMPSGKFLACGSKINTNKFKNLLIINFNSNGTINKSFGNNGYFSLSPMKFYSLIHLASDKILVGGSSYDIKEDYIALARININNFSNIKVPVQNNKITFYPNPTSGILTFELDHQVYKSLSLSITNIYGQNINKHSLLNSFTINISDLQEGVYFFKLYAEGILLANQKIILVR